MERVKKVIRYITIILMVCAFSQALWHNYLGLFGVNAIPDREAALDVAYNMLVSNSDFKQYFETQPPEYDIIYGGDGNFLNEFRQTWEFSISISVRPDYNTGAGFVIRKADGKVLRYLCSSYDPANILLR